MPNNQLKWNRKILEKGFIKPTFITPADFESAFFRDIAERLNEPLRELELVNQIQYRYRISVVHLSLVDDLLDSNQVLLEEINKATDRCGGD